jgi:alginate O-acetyltransferase complex protein AlgI
MLLGGLWHGASWNFVLWGALHGVALAFHRALSRRPAHRPLPTFVSQPLTLLFVMLCWIPFRAPSIGATGTIMKRLFSWEPSGARFYPEALAWGVGLMVIGHICGVALRRATSPSARRLMAFLGVGVYDDSVCGTSPVLSARTIGGAFLLTTWLLAIFFFGAVHASPFIYFQF